MSRNLFESLALDLSSLLSNQQGGAFQITPYHDSKLRHFSLLSRDRKLYVENLIKTNIEIIQKNPNSSEDFEDDSAKTVWLACKQLDLTPLSDVIHQIEAGDSVIICDKKHEVLFRTLNFFKYCSYTLEELYSIPWPDLIALNASGEEHLYGTVAKFSDEHCSKTYNFKDASYIYEEKISKDKLRGSSKLRLISPLTQKQEYAGYLIVLSGTKVLL